jgi:hypothetical protein
LGHVAAGRWEIRRQHVGAALDHVMAILLEKGLVEAVRTDKGTSFVPANKYIIGKPFARPGHKASAAPDTGGANEAVSEYEQDRAANMARNAAFLASLGL